MRGGVGRWDELQDGGALLETAMATRSTPHNKVDTLKKREKRVQRLEQTWEKGEWGVRSRKGGESKRR